MKKILAIAMALVMVLSLTVAVFAEDVIYNMVTTGGQYMDGIDVASGAKLDDGGEGGWGRLATNWVQGGTVLNDVLEAFKNTDASVRITFTGDITQIGFQTENGGLEMTDIPAENITEADGKKVAIVPVATIVANAPFAIANDNTGFFNFMLTYSGDTVLYGFEVVSGLEAAAAPAETEEPAETEAPAETTAETEAPAEAPAETPAETPAPEAPKTGLALAVVPAVMALAAVAVSKKH